MFSPNNTYSREYVKSLINLKVGATNKILDFNPNNKNSLSTASANTPNGHLLIDISQNSHIFSIASKDSKLSYEIIHSEMGRNKNKTVTNQDICLDSRNSSFKSRLTQSYRTLSVETNNKVKNWKNEAKFEDIKDKKRKNEIFFKKNELEKKMFYPIQKNGEDNNHEFMVDQEKINKIPNVSKDPIKKVNKNNALKRVDSKEYAEKIISKMHTRMESFTKTYDNISQKLNNMISKIKENKDEQELILSSNNSTAKVKRGNLRYSGKINENEY